MARIVHPTKVEIPNIDVLLSTRASESTLANLNTKADNLSTMNTKLDNLSPMNTKLDNLTTIDSKLATLQRQYANDYDVISIDLSTARTDQLVAQGVTYLKILNASQGATYSLKLFGANKPALTEVALPLGTEMMELDNADVYISNAAQAGKTLSLFVFKRI